MKEYIKYKDKDKNIVIFCIKNNCWIPPDPNNTDYQEFLKYESTTIEGTIDKEIKDL